MLPNQKLTETQAEQNKIAETPKPISKLFSFAAKKKSKAKANFDSSLVIMYIYPLTILIIVGILVWFFSFLYNNVYLTMAQAEVVSGLKVRVISEQLKKDKFNEILKSIADKSQLASWNKAAILKSPFAFGARNTFAELQVTSTPIIATSTIATTTSSTLPILNVSTTPKITATKTPVTTTKVTTTKATTTKK